MNPLTPPSLWQANAGPRSLKIVDWPPADRKGFAAALDHGDDLEPTGRGSTWADSTKIAVKKSYGAWLRWGEVTGQLDLSSTPADRVSPEAVQAYVADLRLVNASMSVATKIGHLCRMMRIIAPDGDWHWLSRLEARLKRHSVPARDKPSRVVPSARLFAFGARLMNEAHAARDRSMLKRAARYRDGLAIALLAARPLRRRNFSSIEIGRHLSKEGDHHVLQFEGAETKNHDPIDLPFPVALEPCLHRYLEEYRPILLKGAASVRARRRPPGEALWLSEAGSAMSGQCFYLRVCRLTAKEFGHSINPHLFRDCAATSIAKEDPDHMGMIRISLGQRSHRTAERYYIHAGAREAVARHQKGIIGLRRNRGRPHRRSK